MDYFAEIAEHPELRTALQLLGSRNLVQQLEERLRALENFPDLWRFELINWFYDHSDLAAEAWRKLHFCPTQLALLAATLAATRKMSRMHRLMRLQFNTAAFKAAAAKLSTILKLVSGDDEKEIRRKLNDYVKSVTEKTELDRTVAEQEFEGLSYDLEVRLVGPETIEKIVAIGFSDSKRPSFWQRWREGWRWQRLKERWQSFKKRRKIRKFGPTASQIADLIKDRQEVRRRLKSGKCPVPFSVVHEEELEQIRTLRGERKPPQGQDNPPPENATATAGSPFRQALSADLLGLAFSGGGIRSATFNLGVLQALAKHNLLRFCDYFSTVSGGGYIGSWFHAWLKRESSDANGMQLSFEEVQNAMLTRLSPVRSPDPQDARVRPIRYLREFSNYLTPRTGLLSADTWTMVAIYVRNLLLNLLVLLPAIGVVLLVPRLLSQLTQLLFSETQWRWLVPLLILICVGIAMLVLIFNLRRSTPGQSTKHDANKIRWFAKSWAIQSFVVIPFLTAAWLTGISSWLWIDLQNGLALNLKHWARDWPSWLQVLPVRDQTWSAAFVAGIVFLFYFTIIHIAGRFYACWSVQKRSRWDAWGSLALATFGAAGAATGLFWVLGQILQTFRAEPLDPDMGIWVTLAYGTPITLATYSFIVVIQLGLLGAKFPDEQREWWSRLRAWTIIYSLGWAFLFTFAVFVPLWIQVWGITSKLSTLGGWALSTFLGIQTGRKANTNEPKGSGAALANENVPSVKTSESIGPVKKVIALVAPYIFIAGLLAVSSCLVQSLLNKLEGNGWQYLPVWQSSWTILAVLIGSFAAISLLFSWRIGVNEFSMHHFYKNRLVRCYLGASRWATRKANWFTGFDSEDDVYLSRFDQAQHPEAPYYGAYPILNAALNLVSGRDLAWQERKATSFVFTPKYCGYDIDRAVLTKRKESYFPDAYAPTFGYFNEDAGPMLGTAMGISGAAANPNMGKATSSASAFLMTVFNVRLGWWLPNPRRKGSIRGWDRSGPRLGLTYTAIELFGLTDDEKKFVNVSDGGHFENLGVYELIRRGCRYIVACDAGQDRAFNLEDLGNLVRKCRTDFGVEIEISSDQIRDRNQKGWSKTHCVVGKIHYLGVPRCDKNGLPQIGPNGLAKHEIGYLLYLKPSITGDEASDILEYYSRIPEFPHESTADQWFNESQFESYRKLGMHIAETAFARYDLRRMHILFPRLEQFWHPPSPKVAEHSTSHAEEYSRIMELIRASGNLQFLDTTLFNSLPRRGLLANQRDEFYICNALIQLIENVYADLELEQNYNHPHVRGWMKIFQRWVREAPFERTWRLSKNSYAPRFQQFYDDRLVNGFED